MVKDLADVFIPNMSHVLDVLLDIHFIIPRRTNRTEKKTPFV